MQLERMTDRHRQYLAKNFDMSEDRFVELCKKNDGDPEFESFFDELVSRECDAAEEYEIHGEYSEDGLCAIELIDIICGPYDPDEINAESEPDDEDEVCRKD